MIIPIGHERDTVQRIPIVTFVIMGLCILVYILISFANKNIEKDLTGDLTEMVKYYALHSYLKLDPRLEQILGLDQDAKDAIRENFRNETVPIPSAETEEVEQGHFDSMMERILEKIDNIPFRRWGLIPSEKTVPSLFTHMFLHSDWLHLLSNLFLLFLCGPLIEDVWGRGLFLVFYIIAGVFAGLVYSFIYPDLTGPLIGASGAIAGVMGAFLIRHWKVRIRFFYFLFVVRGTFYAPAWLMLPMWFILEFVNARAMDIMSDYGGGGVAHWAHVWGFVFGVIFAFILKALKVEEKRAMVEKEKEKEDKDRYVDENYRLLDQTGRLIAEGKREEAWQMLMASVPQNPDNLDAVEQMWNLALEMGRDKEAAKVMIRVIEKELREKKYESAMARLRQVRSRLPNIPMPASMYLMEIQALIHHGDVNAAQELYRKLAGAMNERTSPTLLVDFCRLAIAWDQRFGMKLAPTLIQLCLEHPEVPKSQKEDLERQLFYGIS